MVVDEDSHSVAKEYLAPFIKKRVPDTYHCLDKTQSVNIKQLTLDGMESTNIVWNQLKVIKEKSMLSMKITSTNKIPYKERCSVLFSYFSLFTLFIL